MFNGAMEDTKRGRGWRLMERRLPSVSSQQSDLLIAHCFGFFFFYLTLHANWQQGLRIRGRRRSILSGVCLPVELIRKGLIDLFTSRPSTYWADLIYI